MYIWCVCVFFTTSFKAISWPDACYSCLSLPLSFSLTHLLTHLPLDTYCLWLLTFSWEISTTAQRHHDGETYSLSSCCPACRSIINKELSAVSHCKLQMQWGLLSSWASTLKRSRCFLGSSRITKTANSHQESKRLLCLSQKDRIKMNRKKLGSERENIQREELCIHNCMTPWGARRNTC